ncbi:hypothetical protein [Amycolatopsis orientalis]|uniref:hypothetical protein n=1 Tax=Amycolatopsis orientalis TaxID=31958 RepID=UPI0003A898E0|nr:hypothetical protein [Amycolatopsis orientalis]
MTTTVDPPAALDTARMRTWHRPSLWFAAAMAVAAVLTVAAMLLDQRTLLGAPVWAKPFKFAVSGALYYFTWSWLVSLLRGRLRTVASVATTVSVVLFAGEYVAIVFQAARARPSHFANTSPFDAALFQVMGMMVAGLWLATLVTTVVLMFTRIEDRAVYWAVRTGAVVALLGAGLGATMTGPTTIERAEIKATGHSDLIGAHSVGVADGGPGLPLLGWSTTGGDLRIAHFVGLHALQALPLLAFGLAVLATRLPQLRESAVRVRLVWTGSVGYAALVGLILWQAERGEPLIRPSGTTLAAAGLLAGVIAAAIAASVLTPARKAVR